MRRTITMLAAVVAATMAIGVIPALAVDDGGAGTTPPPQRVKNERVRPQRTFPPQWIGQSADEIRDELAERVANLEERVSNNDRLTDQQKADAIARLDATVDAVADLDEPAEVIGTIVSRRQLTRIEFRAMRNGETADLDGHVAKDVENFSRRLEYLQKITGWAEAAGEDVGDVSVYLDNAAGLLEDAGGNGTVEDRHDAAHIARAWMTQASVALMAL